MRAGLVESMNRPGKATGVNFFTGDLGGKRLELLCANGARRQSAWDCCSIRVSGPKRPSNSASPSRQRRSRSVASWSVQAAGTDAEIETAFAALVAAGVGGLVLQNDPFFDTRRSLIVALSSRNRLPGIFHIREFPADGGLMSYGASLSDTYRQLGVYTGKILRGAKADDLPVLRPTKFEMVINTQTAKTLGLAVPQSILIASDELID